MKKILLFIIPIFLLVSCVTKREFIEVPVEVVRTEHIVDTRLDSIYIRDSVDRWIKGDTVFIYKEQTKYKYRYKTDTVVRVDSVPKILKQKEVVEVNRLKWYQEILMRLGVVLSLLLIMYIVYKIRKK